MKPILITLLLAVPVTTSAQQPTVQNGRIEARTGTSIDREIAALSASPEPVWAGWRVPMVDGDRNLCSNWSDGQTFVRGETLEPTASGERTTFQRPTGPVPLEAGTSLIVLARMVDGHLERIRSLGDDCPIDAGGRTIYWLSAVTPAESVRYLETLTRQDALNVSATRRIATSALSAIGYHRDAAATTALDRLTAPEIDRSLRRQAATSLASTRGAHGLDRLLAMLTTEKDRDNRQAFVSAIGDSPQPQAVDALLRFARTDPDASVRSEAAYRYVRRAGSAGMTTALDLIAKDTDENVKKRVVSAIGSLTGNASTPVLIQLARSNQNLAVRKEAVSALGRSKDPGAVAFLQEIVAR